MKYENYNPFLGWSKKDMINYYQNYRKELAKDIIELISTNNKVIVKKKAVDVFHGLSVFSIATTSPYGLCKNKIQAYTQSKSSINLPIMSYMVEPQHQEQDECRVNCCAPTCGELCHIPNNACGGCCNCCDTCVNCMEPCRGCQGCV